MTTRTNAVVIDEFGPIEAAEFREVTLPEPGAGELLIDVAFVPANFVDTLVFTGKYQFLPDRPFSPGKGPSGTVAAVGPNVTGFAKGDRVLSMAESGGYAGQAIVPAANSYKLPDKVSCEDAAVLSLAFDTAWVSLFERGRLAPGETVLVLGATGAVGNAAIQLAHARGAKVLAAIRSAEDAREVRAAGADGVVDLSKPDLRNSLRDEVRAQTGGVGADIVIDPIGGDAFDAALRAVAWRGRVVVIGFAAGRIPEIKANYLLLKNIEVSGIQISDYRVRMPELMREAFDEILSLAAEGKVSAGARSLYPLEQWAKALNDLLERKVAGRVLLVPKRG